MQDLLYLLEESIYSSLSLSTRRPAHGLQQTYDISIKAVHTASQGSLSVSHWLGHLETATLVVGAAKCLVQVNKEVSLVSCFLSAQLGRRPRGQCRTSKRLSLTAQGE